MDLPSGTVALLFTDIESSMMLWTADPASMAASLEAHDRVMTEQIESGGGYVFTRAGDSFSAAFTNARDAVAVAQRCQLRLAAVEWPGPELRVRMGLHVGEVQSRDGDYFGPTVNIAARVADTGHGGQIVATADVLEAAGPVADARPLGVFRLKSSPDAIELHQVGVGAFPELRAAPLADESLRFDHFVVDVGARTLLAEGEPVHVEPQVLDVLIHLIVNRDRLISREELLDEVWGDQFVSLSALTTRIKQARQALGDDGRAQRYIRNERGRGYQFVGEVVAAAVEPEPITAAPARPRPASGAADRVVVFGRDADRIAVAGLVDANPVTTIVGPGGVGKTTLVRALVADWATAGRSAAFVRLDTAREPQALLPAVSTVLGLALGDDDDAVARCAEWLSGSGQVLVLDNCEHLLDPVRDLVLGIHAAAPDVPILATSRQPLGLRSEAVHRLTPLAVPDRVAAGDVEAWPCLELFAATAQRTGGMQIGDGDWAEVVELCRRLDGLPLAIELAASRLSTLGIRDLVGGLDDRLDWFRSRDVDFGERQRSLRSTVDWSFRFLEDDCVRLVAGLALFPAGLRLADTLGLAAALGVGGPVEEAVSRLVDASVVVSRTREGETRFTMLETIRQFAAERLDADPVLRDLAEGHLVAHALGVAQDERDAWTGARDPRTRSLARLRAEVPNLRAARDLMLSHGDRAAAIRLATGLCAFTEEACLAELWSWHDPTPLAADDHDAATAAELLLLEAQGARNQGDIERSRIVADAAAEAATDPWVVGRARHTQAMATMFSGDPIGAAELWLESDDHLGGCRGRLFAAMACAFAGELERATGHLAACSIEADSRVPIDLHTNVHLVRGEIARIADTGTARDEFERAADVAREHGLLYSLGMAQVPLVAIADADGDVEEAANGYRELLEIFLRSGTWTHLWTVLRNAASLLATHDPAMAVLVHRAADRDPGAPALDDTTRADVDDTVAAAARVLGDVEMARLERRAQIAGRADVLRSAADALGELT